MAVRVTSLTEIDSDYCAQNSAAVAEKSVEASEHTRKDRNGLLSLSFMTVTRPIKPPRETRGRKKMPESQDAQTRLLMRIAPAAGYRQLLEDHGGHALAYVEHRCGVVFSEDEVIFLLSEGAADLSRHLDDLNSSSQPLRMLLSDATHRAALRTVTEG